MIGRAPEHGHDYRQGYREALRVFMRGLLGVEADLLEMDGLIADLSRYEEEVDLWLAGGDADPPEWRPTAEELGARAE